MRQINVLKKDTANSASYLEIKKRMEKSLAFEVSNDELIEVLNKIRKGNKDAIPGLINASERMIYSVMLSMPESRFSIEERFTVAKQALENLAVKELNSERRESLLRFGAFQVKQALLGLESIQNADYETNKND